MSKPYKTTFYALLRYKDPDGSMRMGYIKKQGESVPNNLGISLAVYRTVERSHENSDKEVKVWYVVDTDSGLAVGEGSTKNAAIINALDKIAKAGMEAIQKARDSAKEKIWPDAGWRFLLAQCLIL